MVEDTIQCPICRYKRGCQVWGYDFDHDHDMTICVFCCQPCYKDIMFLNRLIW
jgi:C4-type Zn-finger protein